MSKWEKTPFDTIEQAHALAEKMGLNPGAITDGIEIRSFQIWEGRTLTLVAQRVSFSGELVGPVLEKVTPKAKAPPQDPSAPRFSEKDRLHSGPWVLLTDDDHGQGTLEGVEEHWRRVYVNFDNVEVLHIVLYRIKDDEYEYCEDSQGRVWVRVLEKKK